MILSIVRPGATAPTASSLALRSDLEQIERLTNQLRAARGLAPVRLDVRELGIGIARNRQTDRAYWVMMLGSRQESFAPTSEFLRLTFGPISPFRF